MPWKLETVPDSMCFYLYIIYINLLSIWGPPWDQVVALGSRATKKEPPRIQRATLRAPRRGRFRLGEAFGAALGLFVHLHLDGERVWNEPSHRRQPRGVEEPKKKHKNKKTERRRFRRKMQVFGASGRDGVKRRNPTGLETSHLEAATVTCWFDPKS